MKVPRIPNSYGNFNSDSTGVARYRRYPNGTWSVSSTNTRRNSATRLVPVRGTETFDGWKLPTAWGSHAFQRTLTSYTYRYNWLGQEYEATGTDGAWDGAFGTFADSYLTTRNKDEVIVAVPSHLSVKSNLGALNAIKDSDINASVALAEMNETLRLIGNTLYKVRDVLRDVKRGRWASAWKRIGLTPPRGSRAKTWGEHWLEYQYGWKPLVSDVFGLQQQLMKEAASAVFSAKSQTSEEIPISHLWQPTSIGNPGSGGGQVISRTVYHVRLSSPTLFQLNQWGLTNPALVVWEVIPFSFVVDWFLPIGSWLEGLTATLGTSFVAGFEDRIVQTDFGISGQWGTVTDGNPMSQRCRQFSFERRLKPHFEPPGIHFGTGLNFTRAANALALIAALR